MNASSSNENLPGREALMSALFANMILQQTNLALMLLGRTPHPESGEMLRDIDGAKLFIDQLEMLETKTRGNLDSNEEKLLKQSLMTLRMAFVEAVDSPPPEPNTPPPAPSARPEKRDETAGASADVPPADDESRKKFSKKY